MKRATYFLLPILLAVVHDVMSWNLEVNQNTVTLDISTNIILECRHDSNDMKKSPTFSDIFRMQILKARDDNKFTPVAVTSLRNPTKAITPLESAVVTGNLNGTANTFIKIKFEQATEETLGQYICEIDGFDQFHEFQAIKTNLITITSKNISLTNLINTVLDMGKIVKKDHFDLKKLKQSLDTISDKIALIDSQAKNTNNKNFEHRTDSIYSILDTEEKVKDLVTFVDFYRKYVPILDWPGGEYSLLKPDTGCPGINASIWQFSSLRVTTVPNGIKDHGSNELNLFGNVFQFVNDTRYVNFQFCTMVSKNDRPIWPRGTYCIQSHQWEDCPHDFTSGYIHYGRHNVGKKDLLVNFPGYEKKNSKSYIYVSYCCRSDGKIWDPMVLPRQKPFYLFRYGGECQEVFGMKHTNQWIYMYLRRGSSGVHSKYVPDTYITDGVKHALCYYTPIV